MGRQANDLNQARLLMSKSVALNDGRLYLASDIISLASSPDTHSIGYLCATTDEVFVYGLSVYTVTRDVDIHMQFFVGGSTSGGTPLPQASLSYKAAGAPFLSIMSDVTVSVGGTPGPVIPLLGADTGLENGEFPMVVFDSGQIGYITLANQANQSTDIAFELVAARAP